MDVHGWRKVNISSNRLGDLCEKRHPVFFIPINCPVNDHSVVQVSLHINLLQKLELQEGGLQKISGELYFLKERVDMSTMAGFIKLNNRHIERAHNTFTSGNAQQARQEAITVLVTINCHVILGFEDNLTKKLANRLKSLSPILNECFCGCCVSGWPPR